MIEATFPLLGTAFVVLIVLPAFALLAKAGLVMLERDEVGGPLHGLNLRYVVLTASSALPLAWLLSAGLHQVETGKSALACLLDHDTAELCFEPGFFALVLAAAVLASSLGVIRKHRGVRSSSSDAAGALRQRVTRIVASDPGLACLQQRVVVTDDKSFALGTHGWLKPRVFIGSAFASRLSDEMLASALGHEAEHVRALDPLRYLILQLALAVNPFGRFLLEPHAARWQAAREAHCDREAVIHGAAPLRSQTRSSGRPARVLAKPSRLARATPRSSSSASECSSPSPSARPRAAATRGPRPSPWRSSSCSSRCSCRTRPALPRSMCSTRARSTRSPTSGAEELDAPIATCTHAFNYYRA